MLVLLRDEEIRGAERFLTRVFRSCDPMDEPFSETIVDRFLFADTGGQFLEEHQFKAIARAAQAIGEKEAFACTTERYPVVPLAEGDCYRLDLGSGTDGLELREKLENRMVENALFSTAGTWGVLISHEWFAVVGGSSPFISSLKCAIQDPEGEARKFIRIHGEADWLPALLTHIYGSTQAQLLLRDSKLGQ